MFKKISIKKASINKQILFNLLAGTILFTLFSCGTTNQISDNQLQTENETENETEKQIENTKENKQLPKIADSSIKLLFAGDVMAHEENFVPGKFDRIWKYVAPKIQEADLAFCNLESPVMDSKGWRAYPSFNMHTDYVEEAIKAGFDVFSLANNHTNDQFLQGINSTRDFFKKKRLNGQEIWAAGLREKADAPLTYQLIEKKIPLKYENGEVVTDENGAVQSKTWKILFVAITELLNRADYSSYIDYYPSTTEKRREFKNALKKLKSENECDLFVVSMHSDEPEYVLKVSQDHNSFCHQLIEECSVDIVWSNHPHVVQTWEKFTSKDGRETFIMYANGNTISGQRRDPQFKAPETLRDYTGEGIFMEMDFTMTDGKVKISDYKPHLITVMVSDDTRYVLRFLNDELLDILDKAEYLKWKNYLADRKRIMENYLPELKKK